MPTAIAKEEKTFGSLTKKFLENGFKGYRLADKNSDKYEYKKSTIKKYTKIANTYLLLKGSSAILEKLSKTVEYNEVMSMKPLKDYTLKEIEPWHIECVQHRLKDTKVVANDVVRLISIIYSWSYQHNHWKGVNPAYSIGKFPERKIKARLSDTDVDLVLDYCESKAFDFNPRFLCIVALFLLLGKRVVELVGLRWSEPYTETEKEECSGWLYANWKKEKYLHLRDTKNRKDEEVYLDSRSIAILERLERSRFTNANEWAVKSPYLFPQRYNVNKHANDNSFVRHLRALNEKLGLQITVGDTVKNKLSFKLCRKTFGSQTADKHGLEIASRKLNHSSTKVTKDHYIVPNDKALEIENVYESNVESIERFKKVK